MTRPVLVLMLLAVATPLTAQDNPFKPKNKIKRAMITYSDRGVIEGTTEVAKDGDRLATLTRSTSKMMGQEVRTETLTLVDKDSMYTVDLVERKGTARPNLARTFADAYDDLSKDEKKRLHENLELTAHVYGSLFGLGTLSQSMDPVGEETIAGHPCEMRKYGNFEICSHTKSPDITLKTKGEMFCMEFEQVATSVTLDQNVPKDRLTIPTGVVLEQDTLFQHSEEMAAAMIKQMASEEYRDSLLAAQRDMEGRQAEAEGQEMTPEEREAMCAQIREAMNIDLGSVMSSAFSSMAENLAASVAEDALESAQKGLLGGIKKRVKIP